MTTQSSCIDNLSIRTATGNDASVVYDFLCALEKLPLDQAAFLTVFHYNLESPTVHYLVAERANEVVGFVSCHVQYLLHHCGKVGEIQELFVRPDVRNQQIGQRLVDALTTLAVREGFVNLEVTTNQKRTDTIRFYEREAFTHTHVKLVKPILTDGSDFHENK